MEQGMSRKDGWIRSPDEQQCNLCERDRPKRVRVGGAYRRGGDM